MKRALVVALLAVFGLAGWAQLTGSFSASVVLVPIAADLEDLISLSAAFAVNYEFDGLKLGLSTGFDKFGFSSFSFSASGTWGPLTVSSEMVFLPANANLTYTFTDLQIQQTLSVPITKTFSDVKVTRTLVPKFGSWTTSASLDFAGLTVGYLFLLKAFNGNYEHNDTWYWNGSSATQTKSWSAGDSNCATTTGSGWKLTLSMPVGSTKFTSLTYFGMTESDERWATTYKGVYYLKLGKRGVYTLSGNCGMGFTEEYVLIEGIPLCCGLTMDAALKITCADFGYLRFLIKNLPFPCCGISFDLGISFTTTTKNVAWKFNVADITGCIAVDLDTDPLGSGTDLTALRIKKVDYSCSFGDCLSFAATTVLYKDTAFLYSLKTINSVEKIYFFIPDTCRDNTDAVNASGVGYYTEISFPKYKWIAWEKYSLSICGAGCCGGQWSVAVTTYFGDRYELKGFKYDYFDGTNHQVVSWGVGATVTAPTTDDTVAYDTTYQSSAVSTLFNWMATEFSVSIPVITNLSVTLGGLVSVQGFESLSFGFSLTF